MRIEDAAYRSRWRSVCPDAKAVFALAGGVAAFAAATPLQALAVAIALMLLTWLAAGTPLWLYLRAALPATAFLGLSCLSLLVTLGGDGHNSLVWQLATDAAPRIAELASRSLAVLAALLFLIFSTPSPDLIDLLRRLHTPEALLDLMLLCYRMLSVFSEALHDTLTAQQARLGHGSPHHRLRSLGLLTANLAVQIWLRAHALHQAGMARHGEGALRFLPRSYPAARRDLTLAVIAGNLLVFAASR